MGAKTLLTLEQFERLPEVEGISYELDEGELIEVPNTILLHDIVRDRLARKIANYLESRNSRSIAITEHAFQLAADTVRIPDIAFIQNFDIDASVQRLGPALAVEITSPSNTIHDLARKIQQYLAAGAKTVWVVVLPAREVHVYSSSAHPRILCGEDLLDEPALLPGFSIRVSDLFEV